MSTKNYDKGVSVRAYQRGGERRTYGRPVKAVLAYAKTGKTSLNIYVHVGDQRRVAAVVEVDVAVLREPAWAISGNAEAVA